MLSTTIAIDITTRDVFTLASCASSEAKKRVVPLIVYQPMPFGQTLASAREGWSRLYAQHQPQHATLRLATPTHHHVDVIDIFILFRRADNIQNQIPDRSRSPLQVAAQSRTSSARVALPILLHLTEEHRLVYFYPRSVPIDRSGLTACFLSCSRVG